jgi:hypothetical protein
MLNSALLLGVDGRRPHGHGWLVQVGWPEHRRQFVLLTQDVEEFGALRNHEKPRASTDRFAHKHGVVVVRPACGERDTCDNSGPDYEGGATMDPPLPVTPAHILAGVAAAESTVGPAAPLPWFDDAHDRGLAGSARPTASPPSCGATSTCAAAERHGHAQHEAQVVPVAVVLNLVDIDFRGEQGD